MLLIFGIIVSSRNDCHKLIYLQHNDRNLFTASAVNEAATFLVLFNFSCHTFTTLVIIKWAKIAKSKSLICYAWHKCLSKVNPTFLIFGLSREAAAERHTAAM